MSDHFDITLERKLESKPEDDGSGVSQVRRLELITGTARRRKWPAAEKARILIESLEPGINISEVARRNAISPQQLFAWRREARALFDESANQPAKAAADAPALALTPTPRHSNGRPQSPATTTDAALAFASVVIAAPTGAASPPPGTIAPGTIEIGIGDAVVRVIGRVEVDLLAMVLRAVRRSS